MTTRTRLAVYGVAAVSVVVAAGLWWKLLRSHGEPVAGAVPMQRAPRLVDVVLVTDTTATMGAVCKLEATALWRVASHLFAREPTLDLRVGLVAYRDVSDEYRTKTLPLTADLDAVDAELAGYIAEGGGDVPEDVDAGLSDAVERMSWRAAAAKVVILIGDAPPADRGGVPAAKTAKVAASRGIRIDTVRLYSDPDTERAWREIAAAADGVYRSLPDLSDVRDSGTPFDDEVAALSRAIDDSEVIYGDAEAQRARKTQRDALAEAGTALLADRAAFYAVSHRTRTRDDIVELVATHALDPAALVPAKLPESLRALSPDDLAKDLGDRARKRATTEARLREVAGRREAYLRQYPRDDLFGALLEELLVQELAARPDPTVKRPPP
jgi:hypothetical protein